MSNKDKKTALVSGASKGIGQVVAESLALKGYRVFGTSRKPGKRAGGEQIEMLVLDVCDQKSVRNCVEEVLSRAGRIDLLVNNAGYALTGAAEATAEEEVQAQFQVNYFGLVRLTNAVLPVMRGQQGGHIVNVSSLVGFAAIPFMAHYSASKFAVEGYSEALHQELMPFGIGVSLIQPGVTKTELYGKSGAQTRTTVEAYAPWIEKVEVSMAERIKAGIVPEKVAEAVVRAVAAQSPALQRYPAGPDASLVSRLKRYVPPAIFQKIWRKQMGLVK